MSYKRNTQKSSPPLCKISGLPYKHKRCMDEYVEEGEEVEEVGGEDVFERFVGMPWPRRCRFPLWPWLTRLSTQTVPWSERCEINAWATGRRCRVGDFATAVESKIDQAIAVALDEDACGPEEVEEGRQKGEERVVL